jgi:hypothetical protein
VVQNPHLVPSVHEANRAWNHTSLHDSSLEGSLSTPDRFPPDEESGLRKVK